MNRPIFRPSAVQHYLQAQQESVLPRFISPRSFTCLWTLLGLLGIGGTAAWSTRMPVYASGTAVVVDDVNEEQLAKSNLKLIVFLPPETQPHLKVGQALLLQTGSANHLIREPIVTVESEVMSPHTAQKRFNLSVAGMKSVTQPASVAVASFNPPSNSLPESVYIGSVYPVDVEIGSKRTISILLGI